MVLNSCFEFLKKEQNRKKINAINNNENKIVTYCADNMTIF